MNLPVDLAAALAAYLLGSCSFAYLVSRAFGLADPTSYGSGNPGATNVLRTGHKSAAALTLAGDLGKGVLAVAIARLWGPEFGLSTIGLALVAGAVFLGHLFPIWFRFRGGKGVATAAGVLWALDWRVGLAVSVLWIAVFALSRISSLSALVAAAAAPLVALWLWGHGPLVVAVFAIALVLLWRHRDNIARLRSGQEGAFRSRQR
ncbi:MAG: glycerol-3-phosphate 1-O-acyltransferase PlsY [Casimicrobiaceae bacterium]|nr:glycerol-3-phosphate 1-O-acyltransferase PlsY [Casimicrobiaceae bacterium]MCX8098300.1 glycerol-3-phosphate 1-O-acyltransferase PlsY [Casimicrobiaceae bacterium]MDW8311764.1 glycerol-3-phosphate 1-O-acyltransferase PlsY [Burkholderiales bacterium]